MKITGLYISIIFLTAALAGQAQRLDESSRIALTLSDGTGLVLFRSFSSDSNSKIFYYLPANMQVAHTDSGPEISLIKYDTENGSGAILHFLLTWGLTEYQQKEANHLLNSKLNDTVFVAGPVLVDASTESFVIAGNDKIVSAMNSAITRHSRAPVVPGSKMAASFKFNSSDLEYVSEMIRDPLKKTDGRLQMIFTYSAMVRDGYISKPSEHEWILEMDLNQIFKYLRN